jgi:serine/threonine protein kinase
MYHCKQILALLLNKYPTLEFLEGYNNAVHRFNNKQIILFRYRIMNRNFVVKYYNLEHLDSEYREKEEKAVLDEFRLAKAFQDHPNVINVYEHDVLMENGQLIGVYYTMDYFNITLDKLLIQKQKFYESEVMNFLEQMDSVLSYAHFKAGIIHSDIKPANIGVVINNSNCLYKLMDFDVSVRIQKEAKEGQDFNFTISDKINIRGMTPAYAAPEQVLAQINPETAITGKADTFAVGVIAAQMLTGQAPMPIANSLFYRVPMHLLNAHWHKILSSVCNPEIRNRPRKIGDVLFQKAEKKISIQAYAGVIGFIGIVVLLLTMNYLSGQKKTTYTPEPVQEQSVIKREFNQPVFHLQQQEEEISEEVKPSVPDFVIVPDLRDRTLNEARNILRQKGISVRNIIYQETSPARNDMVLLSRPAAGERLQKNNAGVDLVVGKGPE